MLFPCLFPTGSTGNQSMVHFYVFIFHFLWNVSWLRIPKHFINAATDWLTTEQCDVGVVDNGQDDVVNDNIHYYFICF